MSNFTGEYLVILTPVTIDGRTIKYDSDLRVIYKETHAPKEARAAFEAENKKLPIQLRHKIEVAGGAGKPKK